MARCRVEHGGELSLGFVERLRFQADDAEQIERRGLSRAQRERVAKRSLGAGGVASLQLGEAGFEPSAGRRGGFF